jgi:hypothetical protein
MYGNDAATAAKADSSAMGYLRYIHGVNPFGLVYLTNMKLAGAEHSTSTMWHSWFAHSSARWARVSDAMPGPPPGYLVGGAQSIFFIGQVLHRHQGNRGISVQWLGRFFNLQQQVRATAWTAATKVVSRF